MTKMNHRGVSLLKPLYRDVIRKFYLKFYAEFPHKDHHPYGLPVLGFNTISTYFPKEDIIKWY